MRVLLVANTLPPADVSGVGEQVLQLAAGLTAAGHQVEVLGRGPGGARGPKLLFPLAVVPAAWRAIRRFRPAVVQVHESDGALVALLARLLRPVLGAPPVVCALLQVSYAEERRAVRPLVTPAGEVLGRPGAVERRFRRFKAPLHAALGRLTASLADLVLAPSAATAEEIRRDYGVRRVGVLPNVTGGIAVPEAESGEEGIGTTYGRSEGREGFLPPGRGRVGEGGRAGGGWPRDRSAPLLASPLTQPPPSQGGGTSAPGAEAAEGERGAFLFVGRLRIRKGVEVLLAAIAEVRRRSPGVRLLVAGDGEHRAAVEERAAALGLGPEGVTFLGRAGAARVRALLGAARALVVPSTYEGMPLVVLEAMAAGVPVVASRVSGIPEVVVDGETGWLVPPEDPAALAAALQAVLADPAEAARRGEAGRRRVAERFTPAAAAAIWEREIRSAVETRGFRLTL